MTGLVRQVENEHFCLRLAERLGIPTAQSRVLTIGGEYMVGAIMPRHWRRLASASGIDVDQTEKVILGLLQHCPKIASKVAAEMSDQGLDRTFLGGLSSSIARRCEVLEYRYRSSA